MNVRETNEGSCLCSLSEEGICDDHFFWLCFFFSFDLGKKKKINSVRERESILSLFMRASENNTLVSIDAHLLIEKWEQVYSSSDIGYLYSACSSCTEPSGSLHQAHSLFLGVKANSIWVGSNFPFRKVCCLGKKPEHELSAFERFHWQDGLFPHFLGLRKQIWKFFVLLLEKRGGGSKCQHLIAGDSL